MVRVKQFNVVCDKPILANNPKRMPGKKSKKKKKKGKKQKREEWESEEEHAVQGDDAITSKADGESEWKPSGGDENTSSKKKKPTRKRRKTQSKGFPQENDLVEIDFGKERFEAVVLDAGVTLIDIKYTVDGSCEFVDRNDLVPRNMVLLKRPEVGSKVEKEFPSTNKKKKGKMKKFKGVVTKIFTQKGDTLFRVKYEDNDEEDMGIMELVEAMV